MAAVAAVLTAGSPAAAAPVPTHRVIAYPSFDHASGLLLNGTARLSAGVLRLTSGDYDQAGAAWSQRTIDSRATFTTSFDVSMSGAVAHGDGMAFVMQSDGPRAIGGLGGSIGYGGMTHSAAVEFDTYRNPEDRDADHVALVIGGRSDVSQPGATTSPVPLFGRLLHVRIGYVPRNTTLTVQVRGAAGPWRPVLSRRLDLSRVLGTRRAYVGFTAATGVSVSTQDVLAWNLDTAVAPDRLTPRGAAALRAEA